MGTPRRAANALLAPLQRVSPKLRNPSPASGTRCPRAFGISGNSGLGPRAGTGSTHSALFLPPQRRHRWGNSPPNCQHRLGHRGIDHNVSPRVLVPSATPLFSTVPAWGPRLLPWLGLVPILNPNGGRHCPHLGSLGVGVGRSGSALPSSYLASCPAPRCARPHMRSAGPLEQRRTTSKGPNSRSCRSFQPRI